MIERRAEAIAMMMNDRRDCRFLDGYIVAIGRSGAACVTRTSGGTHCRGLSSEYLDASCPRMRGEGAAAC